jgi:hypothetical protein
MDCRLDSLAEIERLTLEVECIGGDQSAHRQHARVG